METNNESHDTTDGSKSEKGVEDNVNSTEKVEHEQNGDQTVDSDNLSLNKSNFTEMPPFRGEQQLGRGGNINPFSRGNVAAGGVTGRGTWQAPAKPVNLNGPPPQIELWVETKTADGKSYYYHAISRETTWNKPEGAVRVMTQLEIDEMNKKQQQQQPVQKIQQVPSSLNDAKANEATGSTELKNEAPIVKKPLQEQPPVVLTNQPPPNMLSQPPPQLQTVPLTQPPPNIVATPQPTAPITQQPPPFFPPPGGMHQPPNFNQMPFGYAAGFPGATGGPSWGVPPWNHGQPQHAPPPTPAKSLIIKPGVIDPIVISRAAEWSEHRAPDGRPYYFHAGRGESVWEKPQALRDMEAARMAAHGAQPPVAGTTPAPGIPAHMMPSNPLMHHMPQPSILPAGFDPALAYNAAAAAMASLKANESSKAVQAAAALEKEKKSEEKRKREEEQKKANSTNNTTVAKPVDKSRPISSTPIAGTPWCVVWTGDARVFFYNPSTRTSVWERPEDLLQRSDVDKAVSTPPEQLKAANVQANATEKEAAQQNEKAKGDVDKSEATKPMTNDVEAIEEDNDDDNEIIKIRTESDSSVEEIPTKRSRLAAKLARKADANEAVVEAEVRAAKERAVVPLETRIKQFKEMLREKDVSAFSTWEKELHKIVFDPRYLLLTSKERKQVFEKYVKDRAEEERKEKRNKMRQKREDFRKLMEEAKLHGKSSFSEFCQRFGKEDRYKAVEKIRERESLFNEYIVDVRRREKEEKQQRKEQIRKEFLEMLSERSDSIDKYTRWYDIKKKFENDIRYRTVESSGYREEYFLDYLRQVKEEKRKQRELKEREREKEREKERQRKKDRDRSRSRDRGRDRDRDSKDNKKDKDNKGDKDHKNRDKDKDKDREREKDRDSHREKDKKKDDDNKKKPDESEEGEQHDDEDYEHGSRHSASEDDEAERLQKERERQLREQQSLREREKEVQRTMAGVLRDRDKEREHHKRDEAIGHLNALLTDLVRNTDLSWKEAKRQLRKDHRWDLIDPLDRDDREKIYNEHIDNLMKKKREKFREMLDEVSSLELTSSWKDIKKIIKEDPRYLKYNNSDKCEREFRDYIKDKTIQAKKELSELLEECKLINYKTLDTIKENPNHLKEINDILKKDKRYLILDYMPDERTTIILNYLEELHKRGPPPPPTASESNRRQK